MADEPSNDDERDRYETPVLRVLQTFKKEAMPDMTEEEGGWLLGQILDIVEQARAAETLVAERARPPAAAVDLTIADLVAANLSRVVRWHPKGLTDWSPLEWAGAMCGEAGEAANAAKKLKRIDGNLQNINHEEGRSLTDRKVAAKQVAKEVADTIIYGVLLVASVGEDLPSTIAEVFNAKSEEYGFPERLRAALAAPRACPRACEMSATDGLEYLNVPCTCGKCLKSALAAPREDQ